MANSSHQREDIIMELFFVYNANSNLTIKFFDAVHKIVSPSTYDCELCELTHYSLGARKAWKEFVGKSKIPIQVWYKDRFVQKFEKEYEFPVVLIYDNSGFTCILDKIQLESINGLDELFVLLNKKTSQIGLE